MIHVCVLMLVTLLALGGCTREEPPQAISPAFASPNNTHSNSTEQPDTAANLDRLAQDYEQQEKYVDAERLYKRSLEMREKSLAPDHPDVATSLNNLAGVYSEEGKYAEA